MLFDLKRIYRSISAGGSASLSFEADGKTFIRNFCRQERFILLGCGNIAQPLCRYADDLGFAVTVVDDRPVFANSTLFPNARKIICDSFQNAIAQLCISEHDYVAVITRGHRYDADCLRAILPGTFPRYLGMLGSKRRVIMLKDLLENEGFARKDLERIHAPIGVDINALTVKEIAVSILAELIKCRREDISSYFKGTKLAEEDADLRLLEFVACGETPKALLTVYETIGSTPVKTGAMMAVDKFNRTVGTIGGGCGEGELQRKAFHLIGTGEQISVTLDMSSDIAEEEAMVCGGKMKVLITDLSAE